jgi:hypothetical protein
MSFFQVCQGNAFLLKPTAQPCDQIDFPPSDSRPVALLPNLVGEAFDVRAKWPYEKTP